MSRQHNDANVLAIGARIVAAPLAREILEVWLETPFEGGRHVPRIEQIAAIERGEL
jgi:ribose 5-phosphate isomerase B